MNTKRTQNEKLENIIHATAFCLMSILILVILDPAKGKPNRKHEDEVSRNNIYYKRGRGARNEQSKLRY